MHSSLVGIDDDNTVPDTPDRLLERRALVEKG